MLDGAGASTFLDLIDEHNQQEIKKNSKIIDTSKENNELPFANVARDQTRKSVVFIDSAVPDYETIINSFKENTEFYLINSNEDGFKKIDEILSNNPTDYNLHLNNKSLRYPNYALNQAKFIRDEIESLSKEYVSILTTYQLSLEDVLRKSKTLEIQIKLT